MAQAWQDITSTEIEQRDPLKMELWKKYAARDSANSERMADLKIAEGNTASGTYTTIGSMKIRVHPYLKYLYIQGALKGFVTILGTQGTVYVRMKVGSTYSSEESLSCPDAGEYWEDPFTCGIDLSALSGEQTLELQGKAVKTGGTGTVTMYGKILTKLDDNRRYDSFWGRA